MKKVLLGTCFYLILAGIALAELRVCNKSRTTFDLSIAYEGNSDFISEGWWEIGPNECKVTIRGDLQKRYYYYRAEIDSGPFKGGGYYFCTTPKEYTIVGENRCKARGYDREDFREVDTGRTAKSYTLNLGARGKPAGKQ